MQEFAVRLLNLSTKQASSFYCSTRSEHRSRVDTLDLSSVESGFRAMVLGTGVYVIDEIHNSVSKSNFLQREYVVDRNRPIIAARL